MEIVFVRWSIIKGREEEFKKYWKTDLSERAFFDLENEKFYLGSMRKTIAKRIEAEDPLIVPLSEIISSSRDEDGQFLKSVERIIQTLREQKKLGKFNRNETEYRERLHKLATIFRRKTLCEEFPDEDEEHAFLLFRRLNKGGTSLSAGDVEAARLASAATKKIVEPMRAVATEREMRALGINFIFLVRCLVTVHRGNCSFSKLPKNWAEDTGEVETSWRQTERALRVTVEFVKSEIGWTTRSASLDKCASSDRVPACQKWEVQSEGQGRDICETLPPHFWIPQSISRGHCHQHIR